MASRKRHPAHPGQPPRRPAEHHQAFDADELRLREELLRQFEFPTKVPGRTPLRPRLAPIPCQQPPRHQLARRRWRKAAPLVTPRGPVQKPPALARRNS